MPKTATKPDESNGRLPDSSQQSVVIEPVHLEMIELEIESISPLIVQSWSQKARRKMLDDQMGEGKSKQGREPRDPDAEFEAAKYLSTEGWEGVPASGVKGCIVNACRAVDGLPMTLAKRMIFIYGEGKTESGTDLVRILHDEPSEKYAAMCRLTNGTANERFRPIYRNWGMILRIQYLKNIISKKQVCNLVELAGFVEGLCEHRPGSPKSNTGSYGQFRIKRSEQS